LRNQPDGIGHFSFSQIDMRSILVLTSTYPRWHGDTEPAFVHFLCRRLTDKYRVIVLAPHYPGSLGKETVEGVLVYRFRYFFPFAESLAYNGGIIANLKNNILKWLLVPFFLASQSLHMIFLARIHKVSLIHAHWIIPQGLLAVICRQCRLVSKHIGILCTSHGGDLYSLQGGMLQMLKCYTLRHCDHATVVSTAMRDRLNNMGCSTENISVQSMGVDLTRQFVPNKNAAKTRDIIYVGRLVEKKGVSTLIDSIKLLKKDYPALKVTLVGDGPERSSLVQQCRQLGIDKQVEFTGSIPNDRVPEFYQSAKIAVVPSIIAADGDQEGLGLVAVEALGCGCATIVSDLPALRDVVTPGENGLVFTAGNAAELKDRITSILNDAPLYNHLATSGRQSIIDKFDWQAVGARYLEIMAQCINTADN
jgi:glycosyltransferase involved in cell wall biosynthesis